MTFDCPALGARRAPTGNVRIRDSIRFEHLFEAGYPVQVTTPLRGL
jgi:hypothetical protein